MGWNSGILGQNSGILGWNFRILGQNSGILGNTWDFAEGHLAVPAETLYRDSLRREKTRKNLRNGKPGKILIFSLPPSPDSRRSVDFPWNFPGVFWGSPAGFGALLEAVQVVIPEAPVELVKAVTWEKGTGI